LIAQKANERNRVVALYRRGRLSDAELDCQMDEIGKEEAALQSQLDDLRARVAGTQSVDATISSAEALLQQLRKRLHEPISWERKRRLVEVLVAGIRIDTVEEGGVKRSKSTVTYRFSQPAKGAALTMTASYGAGCVVRMTIEPRTIGDHIRKRRLSLQLLQRHVAAQIGVVGACVWNWEANASTPEIRYMPAIINFLGYNPLTAATGWGDQLIRHRTTLGMTQKEAAAQLGVDQGTLARWERRERQPAGGFVDRVQRFLRNETPQSGRKVG
jgi:DNA-binding transcriptional regulator YiaG